MSAPIGRQGQLSLELTVLTFDDGFQNGRRLCLVEDPLDIGRGEKGLSRQGNQSVSCPEPRFLGGGVRHDAFERRPFFGIKDETDDVGHGPWVDDRVGHRGVARPCLFPDGLAQLMAMDTATGDLPLVVKEWGIASFQRRIGLRDTEFCLRSRFAYE